LSEAVPALVTSLRGDLGSFPVYTLPTSHQLSFDYSTLINGDRRIPPRCSNPTGYAVLAVSKFLVCVVN